MDKYIKWIYPACAIALTVCLCLMILDGRALVKAQFGVAQAEGQKIRDLADRQINQTRSALLQEVHAQLDAVRTSAQAEVRNGVVEAHAVLGETLQRADSAIAQVAGLRNDLHPVLYNAAQLTAHVDRLVQTTDRTVQDIRPQVIGLVAASKIAAGELATSGRDFQRALPNMLITWDKIGTHIEGLTEASEKASIATAKTMGNIQAVTTPLPKWLRIPLGVAGALANPAIGVIEGAAAAGAFK